MKVARHRSWPADSVCFSPFTWGPHTHFRCRSRRRVEAERALTNHVNLARPALRTSGWSSRTVAAFSRTSGPMWLPQPASAWPTRKCNAFKVLSVGPWPRWICWALWCAPPNLGTVCQRSQVEPKSKSYKTRRWRYKCRSLSLFVYKNSPFSLSLSVFMWPTCATCVESKLSGQRHR